MATDNERAQSSTAPATTAQVSLGPAVFLLGVGQIVSWGTLYYCLMPLAPSIHADLGFSDVVIFGAFSAGMLLSGVVAPWVGRHIDNHGGRAVMSYGSIGAAIALAIVALSREPIVYTIGWLLVGVTSAMTLYEPAFASLYQMSPEKYRRSVTGLTLLGGLASTAFWPLSLFLTTAWGWRETLFLYAALHLLVCFPIHRQVLPATGMPVEHKPAADAPVSRDYLKDSRFYWLAASLAAATLLFSALSQYLLPALGLRGFTQVEAGLIAAMIGPMQVLARVVEWLIAGRFPAVKVGIAACVMYVIAMILLNAMPHSLILGLAFAVCYGAANGIITIARGTVPHELFGPQKQGALLGALARPSFLARALAPALFAGALSFGMPLHAGMLSLGAVSVVCLVFFLFACRDRPVA